MHPTLHSVIDETVTACANTGTRDSSVPPQDASYGGSTFSMMTSSKRPSNNHLRPTKSSMLRAKSSMGLPQHEGDSSGKSGGITAKNSLMQEI
mmetsp:Transcript_28039/g.37443  ORF Transcript_28039/g.37443 Transcript_28039/m.37443 type:complete len:93 (+) Transcript_28039:3727-4005(+)